MARAPRGHSLPLRRKISALVRIAEWQDIRQAEAALAAQIIEMEALRVEYQHSIALIAQARRTEPSTYRYTCHMYAFDLMDRAFLTEAAGDSDEIYPGAEFVAFLVDHFLEQTGVAGANNGDFVVYFVNGAPTHSGQWDDGRVRSKWGERGHLWGHGAYEVPLEYGDDVRIFRRLASPDVQHAYRTWAAKRRARKQF